MSLTLPDLDDRTYADLLEEARALIPGLYPAWTNHNPTDPGITLLELFAWLTEMLIFRVNRLPKENVQTFLRLLNGPDWTPAPGPDGLDEDIRLTVADLRKRHRAVTAADYELLAREASPGVARSRCVPLRNLLAVSEAERQTPRPGQVSVILVPDPAQPGAVDPASQPGAPLPSEGLIAAVEDYLEPRRLLTVRQSVAAPVYAPVQAEVVVARRPDVPEATLRALLRQELERFLDPLVGGPEGEGWPFGRDLYASELYQLLEKVPGVDYLPDVALASECPPGAPRCIPATPLWHDNGDFIGLGLGAHHLPWARIDPARLFIGVASSFVPVTVRLTLRAAAGAVPAEVRRQVKEAVRALFHPLHEGPNGQTVWEITDQTLRAELLDLDAIADVRTVQIVADPGRLFQQGTVKGLRLKAGELADVTTQADGV